MPCSRYTAKPATAITATATNTIQRRLSRRPIETRCIRDPFMSGDRRGRSKFPVAKLINLVDGTTRNRTPQHRTGASRTLLAKWMQHEPELFAETSEHGPRHGEQP